MFRYRLVGARPVILNNAENDLPNEVISGYFVAPIRMTSWPKVNLDQFQ